MAMRMQLQDDVSLTSLEAQMVTAQAETDRLERELNNPTQRDEAENKMRRIQHDVEGGGGAKLEKVEQEGDETSAA